MVVIYAPDKPCARCGNSPRVRRSYCRPCTNAIEQERYAADEDHYRTQRREAMRRRRANPVLRLRDNATKRERWGTKYGPDQQVRNRILRERHFFKWRARLMSRHGRVTAVQLAAIWKQQRGLCGLTGRRLDRTAEVDHILPLARGGTNDLSNLRWVCTEANLVKLALTDEELLALCNDVAEWIGWRLREHIKR